MKFYFSFWQREVRIDILDCGMRVRQLEKWQRRRLHPIHYGFRR